MNSQLKKVLPRVTDKDVICKREIKVTITLPMDTKFDSFYDHLEVVISNGQKVRGILIKIARATGVAHIYTFSEKAVGVSGGTHFHYLLIVFTDSLPSGLSGLGDFITANVEGLKAVEKSEKYKRGIRKSTKR